MSSTRHPPDAFSVGEAADLVGGRVIGDPSVLIEGVAPVDQAGAHQMAFLAAPRYARHLSRCRGRALLVSEELAEAESEHVPTRVVVADAHRALALLLEHLHPDADRVPGVHPTAVLGRGVKLGEDVTIGPYAVIEEGAELGDRVAVGAHACVGAGARLGADSRLYPHVVIYPGVELGARVILHAGVRLGVDGFGYVVEDGEIRKVPQVGRCVVEDDVEIGANTCIDRGSIGETRVERGVKLDNLIHLGHNVTVGSMSMLAAMVGVSGSARIGRGVAAGGQVGIGGHLEVGDGARLGGQAGIIGDIAPGETVSGYPARRHRDYLRAMGRLFKLPELAERLKRVEKAVDRLQAEDSGS
jgi:UDP-3-O-[3-hydroxymyristoyl] glucosamine N-acyltransferase